MSDSIRSRSSLFLILTSLLAAALVAISARIAFPIPATDIPQTGQTVAVLAVGALLGARLGGAAIALYLLLGAIGLPVYSDGASGWSVLFGGSVGYFAGFVLAAVLMGVLAGRVTGSLPMKIMQLLLAMMLGHAVILLCGFIGMSLRMEYWTAWQQGVAPFIYGGLVKSVIAMLLVLVAQPVTPALRLRSI